MGPIVCMYGWMNVWIRFCMRVRVSPEPSGVLYTNVGSILTVAASWVLFERPFWISILILFFTWRNLGCNTQWMVHTNRRMQIHYATLSLRPHLQQLFNRQAEFGQRLGNFSRLFGESVGHSRHHGRSFGTAALRQEESNISVRD